MKLRAEREARARQTDYESYLRLKAKFEPKPVEDYNEARNFPIAISVGEGWTATNILMPRPSSFLVLVTFTQTQDKFPVYTARLDIHKRLFIDAPPARADDHVDLILAALDGVSGH